MNTAKVDQVRKAIAVSACALLLVLSGCGSDADGTSTTSTAIDQSSTTPDLPPVTPTTSATTSSSASSTEATTVPTASDTTSLPGEEIDSFPSAGDALGVVGVSHDDTLNIRIGPGADQGIATTVSPVADDLVSTGRARSLPSSIWYEVSVSGETGWANSRFLAFIGGTDDATAEYLAGHDRPTAETMSDLGRIVAEDYASTDPASTIVQTIGPTVGDLGEVTYDVIGIGDDAQIGYRLHLFALEDESAEGFTLTTIERTALCGRGLSGEACV